MLPINIESLLRCSGIESARVEFKAAWDETAVSHQVLKTLCAFANDFQNLNGGYVVLGVEEENGRAVLPPRGLDPEKIEAIQKWLRGNCNRIEPEYFPIASPEVVDGRHILVLWAPASDTRPHRAPDGPKGDKKYWIRLGAETVDAEANGMRQPLLEAAARIPFDSRKATNARVEDLREAMVREFLHDVGSALLEESNALEIYRRMRIVAPVNAHEAPLNVGLLLFSEDPERWFPYARIEVVHFSGGEDGAILEERYFKGSLLRQVRDGLTYLQNHITAYTQKQKDDFRARGWVSYPMEALREALVNAVYHRSYQEYEPVKVYIYANRIEIISYPGPVPGVERRHFEYGAEKPSTPLRNRRLGEFLKELRLAEERGTGLPKIFKAMRANGSPEPRFDFDDTRTYFRTILPAHPEYVPLDTPSTTTNRT